MINKKKLKNPIFCIVAMNEDRIIGDGKKLPKLKISKRRYDINEFRFEDFEITDYDPDPNIPAPVAV